MARKKASFSNDLVHFWNQITGQNLGSAPSYSSLINAILNKGASYPGQSNPNGYVPTSGLRDIPSAPSSTTRKPKSSTAHSIFTAVASELSRPSSSFGSSSSGSSVIPSDVPNYLNADLARHYGMDASTAYQEALANTAHQREVKDLVAAGLNPVLSTRYGGSSGVSGASVYAPAEPAVSGASSAKSASVVADLASGVVGLVTGSSAKSNATRSIVNALGGLVENVFSRE